MNFEQDIRCPECCNVQLLGLNFNEESDNINNFIDLYSFCIFNHKRNKASIQKNNFNHTFNSNSYDSIIYNKDLKCECCNRKPFEYHCFECKRNVCKNCFDYHESHRYYYNFGYLSEIELQEISDNLKRAKSQTDLNMISIEKCILKYEIQLNILKQLFKKYEEINDKLNAFSKYILEKYNELLKLQKPIYYPLYFNLKNILKFEPIPINLPTEDISIKQFTDILTKKIISGCYFVISKSFLTSNLDEYYKQNQFKTYFDIKSLDDFTIKEIEYDQIIPLGENKFCGLNNKYHDLNGNQENNNKEEGIEIYNIKHQMVETKIKSTPEEFYCNEKCNIIIFRYEDYLEIYNLKDFSLIQEISYDESRKRDRRQGTNLWRDNISVVFHNFDDVKFISENTIGLVYEGSLSYLGEEVENLFDHEGIKVINMENEKFDYDCEDYGYFIVYQRNNKNEKFTPKSVSLLLKIFIKIYEVPLQPGEYSGKVEDNSYCIFELDGITQLSNESFIIAFKSRIQISRAQDSYYITDDFYKNETIYYFLNYKENRFIKLIIGKTKEKSYLFKNELDEQFYFLYNNSDKAAKSLKIYFEKYNLSLTTINVKDKLNVRNLYIEKNNIIGYNCNSIYVGKIICGELEVIYNFDLPKMQYLMHISLKNKCIYYKNQSNIIKEYNSILIEDN